MNYQDKRGYVESFDDINLALAYVGQQSNVTGVIVLGVWFLGGSYTYLHLGPDVQIKYVNLRDAAHFNSHKNTLQNLTTNWIEGNYLILPLYQLINTTDYQVVSNREFVYTLLENPVWKKYVRRITSTYQTLRLMQY